MIKMWTLMHLSLCIYIYITKLQHWIYFNEYICTGCNIRGALVVLRSHVNCVSLGNNTGFYFCVHVIVHMANTILQSISVSCTYRCNAIRVVGELNRWVGCFILYSVAGGTGLTIICQPRNLIQEWKQNGFIHGAVHCFPPKAIESCNL